jgi:small conductance mechanosensitive channel
MLLLALILQSTLIGQVMGAQATPSGQNGVAVATTTVAMPTTQAAGAGAGTGATTQPSLQITVQAPPAAAPQSVIDALTTHGFGRYMTGQQTLTVKDVLNPAFWTDNIKDLVLTVLAFVPRLLGTLLFLLVFWLIYRGIRKIAVRSMKNSEVDSSIRDMLATLIKWCVMGFGIVIGCNQLGIPIVAMLTGVSIIGLAVGFAAQETLSNFIAGIVIFLDKPFKVGDWITVDAQFVQVQRVTFRSTRMLTLDGETLILPNTALLSNKVLNHTTHPLQRVNVPVGISYRSSIDEARRTLLSLTHGDPRVRPEPAPEVIVAQLADSSVNLVLRFWITDEALERRMTYEYNERAKKALDAAGVEIPFPHMQVFVEDTPAVRAIAGHSKAA